jgi:hypothetical protein
VRGWLVLGAFALSLALLALAGLAAQLLVPAYEVEARRPPPERLTWNVTAVKCWWNETARALCAAYERCRGDAERAWQLLQWRGALAAACEMELEACLRAGRPASECAGRRAECLSRLPVVRVPDCARLWEECLAAGRQAVACGPG